METSKYEVSNLGPTSKVRLRKNVCKLIMQIYKVICDCIICYDIRPGATIKLTDSISNKYVSNLNLNSFLILFREGANYQTDINLMCERKTRAR